jgi:putative ABC transport system ATP-binding protein
MLLQGVSVAQRRSRSLEILKEVGLAGYEKRWPQEMSGGQQQRVAVARAIVSHPKLVLADEPTANLDSKTSGELLDIMKELNDRFGTTFIFSTHDQVVIERARRVVHLHDGKVAD